MQKKEQYRIIADEMAKKNSAYLNFSGNFKYSTNFTAQEIKVVEEPCVHCKNQPKAEGRGEYCSHSCLVCQETLDNEECSGICDHSLYGLSWW